MTYLLCNENNFIIIACTAVPIDTVIQTLQKCSEIIWNNYLIYNYRAHTEAPWSYHDTAVIHAIEKQKT